MPQDTAIVNFGGFPGSNEASVVVTGQTAILANSVIEVFVMAEASSNRTAKDHRRLGLFAAFTGGNIVVGTEFTIYANSHDKLTGLFNLRWVWV